MAVSAVSFIAGGVISGLIVAMVTYAYLKGRYEEKIKESYNKGYQKGRDVEQRAIFEHIERLNNDPNACVYDAEQSKGSDT